MNDYYKNLPKKWMGSGALIFNEKGKFLIVKPTYRDFWEIPGGGIGENESPVETMKREIKEELDLEIKKDELLCVEYLADVDGCGDRVQFIFDGGIVTLEQIGSLKLPADELDEYRFVTFDEALSLLSDKLHARVRASLEAYKEKRVIYLETLS